MGIIGTIIGALIIGAIVGYLGRLILPGAQDIGVVKTVALGVISAIIVGAIFSGVNTFVALILSAIVAAGLLWLAIRQGWLKPA
ncbi:MAG: GlsB/YeaQ/YmgE family stress response membrane protein [Actinomycetota bacterium]